MVKRKMHFNGGYIDLVFDELADHAGPCTVRVPCPVPAVWYQRQAEMKWKHACN